jgi:DNA-binding LytR/AlgR family response regulator
MTKLKMTRCLIVDDESPARDELRYLLRGFGDVEVVGEAATAEEALVLLDSVDYDIVLLDIRMPGMGGLRLAERLRREGSGPRVIFTTAYPDHAVEAFDLNAADYLVKPFDQERLRRALDRVDDADPEEPEHATVATKPIGRIPVHKGDRVVLVDAGQIVYATAARGYSYLKLAGERVLVSFSLHELQERLPDHFFRCHRSYLVNLRLVREVVPDFSGGIALVMGDREHSRVPVSRRQGPELRRRLGM